MVEIKGTVINDTIDAIKKTYGEEVYLQIIDGLNENDKTYFQKTFLTIGWYDIDAFTRFLHQNIIVTANGDEKELIKRTEIVVEKQLKGLYRFFIRIGSVEFVLKKLSNVHSSYFKGVSIELLSLTDNEAKIRYDGFEKQHNIIGYNIIGFYKKALELSGAKDVHVTFITQIAEDKGYCELLLTWIGK